MIFVAFSLFLRVLYKGFSNTESLLLGPAVWLCQNTSSIKAILWFASCVPSVAFHLGLIQIIFYYIPKIISPTI